MTDNLLNPQKITTTMALGAGTTGVVDIGAYSQVAIKTPSSLTGGTITFLGGTTSDGTTAVGDYSPDDLCFVRCNRRDGNINSH